MLAFLWADAAGLTNLGGLPASPHAGVRAINKPWAKSFDIGRWPMLKIGGCTGTGASWIASGPPLPGGLGSDASALAT
jgi:hypothetical protein